MPMYQQPREGPFDSFMRAFQMGMQLKQQREAMEMEKQDRALRIEALNQEAKRLKLQDKLQAFSMLKGQRGPMTEQPGPQIPALFSAGGQLGVQGPPTQVEGQLPEFDFSEIQPGLKMRPPNMGEIIAQQIAERQREMAMKGQELTQAEQIKAQFTNPEQNVEVPGIGPMAGPSNLLPGIVQAVLAQQEKASGREFTAGENAKDRANRLAAAGITAGGQTVNVETVDENGNPITQVMPKGQAVGRSFPKWKNLSGETASRLAVVGTAERVADQLKKEMKGAGRLKLAGIYAGTNTKINRLIDDLVDADIRIRTGAAANPTEIKARRAQIVRALDLATGDPQPMMDAIDRMLTEAHTTASGILGQRPGTAGPGKVRVYNPATGRLE